MTRIRKICGCILERVERFHHLRPGRRLQSSDRERDFEEREDLAPGLSAVSGLLRGEMVGGQKPRRVFQASLH